MGMHWCILWLLVSVAIVCAGAEENQCGRWPNLKPKQVKVSKQRCLKGTCTVGTKVSLSCKRKSLQLYGPSDVVCMEDGWSSDVQHAQCLTAKNISNIRSSTAPTISLAYSAVPDFTNSLANLTDGQWSEVGSYFAASCTTGWSNKILGLQLPKLDIRWYTSDGRPVPVGQKTNSNVWSEVSTGQRAQLNVNEFTEPGNYTFTCRVGSWHPWSALTATVTIKVEKRLCPHVQPPCNTHIRQPITKQNRTENGTLYFWPNKGWTSPDGHALKTKCTDIGWDPPMSWLSVERMECGHLELPAGMRRRLLDGEQDDHYGALYELSCTDKLTALTGSPRAYCNSSGMWFLEPGTCERVSCGSPPDIPDANCSCPDQSIGAVCNCKCKPGYWFDRGSQKQLECQSTGWRPSGNDLHSCIQCQCQQSTIPDDWKWTRTRSSGYIAKKKVFCHGFTIKVSCKFNKTVQGTLQCTGNSWKWIKQPECK